MSDDKIVPFNDDIDTKKLELEPVSGATKDKNAASEEFPYPDGLVGEIARWIVSTSRKIQPELAVASALVTVGTAAGRLYDTPLGVGINLYCLGIARPGRGKDAPYKAIGRILRAAGLEQHIGASEFSSQRAIADTLKEKPLCVCAMDEFGSFIRRSTQRNAASFERPILKLLREVWSTSLSDYYTTPKAKSSPETKIRGPAFFLLGMSTPDDFYSSLNEAFIRDGTLSRFLVFQGSDNPKKQKVKKSSVPKKIVKALQEIYSAANSDREERNDHSFNPVESQKFQEIFWENEIVEAQFEKFDDEIIDITNNASSEQIGYDDIYARAAENAVRVATIVAIGCGRNQVTSQDLRYGIKLVKDSTNLLLQGLGEHMALSGIHSDFNKIRRIIKEAGGQITHRNLLRKMRIKTNDLKDLINTLNESGEIEIILIPPTPKGGPTGQAYKLT